jgi:hypothetical protein
LDSPYIVVRFPFAVHRSSSFSVLLLGSVLLLCGVPPLGSLLVAIGSLLFFDPLPPLVLLLASRVLFFVALPPFGIVLLAAGRLIVFMNLLLLGRRVLLGRFIPGGFFLGSVLGKVLWGGWFLHCKFSVAGFSQAGFLVIGLLFLLVLLRVELCHASAAAWAALAGVVVVTGSTGFSFESFVTSPCCSPTGVESVLLCSLRSCLARCRSLGMMVTLFE